MHTYDLLHKKIKERFFLVLQDQKITFFYDIGCRNNTFFLFKDAFSQKIQKVAATQFRSEKRDQHSNCFSSKFLKNISVITLL